LYITCVILGLKKNYWDPLSNVATSAPSPSTKRVADLNMQEKTLSSPLKQPRLSLTCSDHKEKVKPDPDDQDAEEPLTDIDNVIFVKEPSPLDKTRKC
jgi:hypothetical protein